MRVLSLCRVFPLAAGLAMQLDQHAMLNQRGRTNSGYLHPLLADNVIDTANLIRVHAATGQFPQGLPGNVSMEDMMKVANQFLEAMRSKKFVRTILEALDNATDTVESLEQSWMDAITKLVNASDTSGEAKVTLLLHSFFKRSTARVATAADAISASIDAVIDSIPNGTLEVPDDFGLPSGTWIGTAVFNSTYAGLFQPNGSFDCGAFAGLLQNVTAVATALKEEWIPKLNATVPMVQQLEPMIEAMAPDVVKPVMKVLNRTMDFVDFTLHSQHRAHEAIITNITGVVTSHLGCTVPSLFSATVRWQPSLLGFAVTAAAMWLISGFQP